MVPPETNAEKNPEVSHVAGSLVLRTTVVYGHGVQGRYAESRLDRRLNSLLAIARAIRRYAESVLSIARAMCYSTVYSTCLAPVALSNVYMCLAFAVANAK